MAIKLGKSFSAENASPNSQKLSASNSSTFKLGTPFAADNDASSQSSGGGSSDIDSYLSVLPSIYNQSKDFLGGIASDVGNASGDFLKSMFTGLVGNGGMQGVAPISAGGMPFDIKAFGGQPAQLQGGNLSQALNIPQTIPNEIGQKIGEWGPIALGGMGVAYNLAKKAPFMLQSSLKNMPYLSDILSQMPKNATSTDLANAATQGGFKGIVDKIKNKADNAYQAASPYIFGPKNNIDLTNYTTTLGRSPSDDDLLQYLDPKFRNPKILQDPTTKQLLKSQWLRDNPRPTSIVNSDVLSQLSKPLKKSLNNLVKNPTGENLLNSRDIAGQELANADWGDATKVNYRDATQQVRQLTDSIMENHLGDDPQALAGWREGNAIRSKMYHPVMNNSSLEKMSSFNPATSTPENPEGTPYYFSGASPKEVNSAVQKAQRTSYGLGPDHPVSEFNKLIQQKLAQENLPKGFFRKNLLPLALGAVIPSAAKGIFKDIFK